MFEESTVCKTRFGKRVYKVENLAGQIISHTVYRLKIVAKRTFLLKSVLYYAEIY